MANRYSSNSNMYYFFSKQFNRIDAQVGRLYLSNFDPGFYYQFSF
jgi:hypothetical protein